MLDLSQLPDLERTIQKHGLSTRKSLGQHFLLDTSITDDVARYAGELEGVYVIEVGPGPGGLTRSLLKAGAKEVHVVEKDDRCIAIMEELKTVAGERLKVIHRDALGLNLLKEVPAPRKIVANLPYNAGTAMLLEWLEMIYEDPTAFESMTLMFQKEVAERIVAPSGCKDFGRLSVVSQWLCDCRYDMELPPEAFTPPPKVSSAVVTLTPRTKPLADVKKENLEKVVAAAFGQRRKMLRQSLKGLNIAAETLLEAAGIEGTLRAEQLSVEELCGLAQTYQRLLMKPGKPS